MPVQPQIVLIWAKEADQGRFGVAFEPSPNLTGEPLDCFRCGGRQSAIEPTVRETETNCLDAPERFVVKVEPHVPKFGVAFFAIEQPSQFVHVRRPQTAAQQMPDHVQRRIAYRVLGLKAHETQAIQFPRLAPFPELIDTRGIEALVRGSQRRKCNSSDTGISVSK